MPNAAELSKRSLLFFFLLLFSLSLAHCAHHSHFEFDGLLILFTLLLRFLQMRQWKSGYSHTLLAQFLCHSCFSHCLFYYSSSRSCNNSNNMTTTTKRFASLRFHQRCEQCLYFLRLIFLFFSLGVLNERTFCSEKLFCSGKWWERRWCENRG